MWRLIYVVLVVSMFSCNPTQHISTSKERVDSTSYILKRMQKYDSTQSYNALMLSRFKQETESFKTSVQKSVDTILQQNNVRTTEREFDGKGNVVKERTIVDNSTINSIKERNTTINEYVKSEISRLDSTVEHCQISISKLTQQSDSLSHVIAVKDVKYASDKKVFIWIIVVLGLILTAFIYFRK